MLYGAWRYGGHDPYALQHMLSPDYRPLSDPEAPPEPPEFPSRLQTFLLGFAQFALKQESGRSR